MSLAPEDFATIVKQQSGRIYRFILKHIGQPDDAQDLAQQTFMEAYKALASFRGDAKFETWLTGIALNVVRNYRNRAPHRRHFFMSDDVLLDLSSGMPSPEEIAEQRQLLQRLTALLAQMKPELREVLVQVVVEGKGYDETARFLGIPIGTVRSRLFRARALLCDQLSAPESAEEGT